VQAVRAQPTLGGMSGKYSWKSVAGTAKKWADNKRTEVTTADRRTRREATGNEVQIERELEQQTGGAVLTMLFPGLGRAIERQEQQRQQAAADRHDQARAEREASVLAGASVEVRGHITGRADDLAVTFTADDETRTLLVLMETVDPVAFDGASLSAAGFALADFHGNGTYPLVAEIESLDPGAHHVVFNDGDSDIDWYYWTDEYGPATAVVSGGAIEVVMPCRNAGSHEVTVTLRVPMP